MASDPRRMTIPDFVAMKARGQKITMLTAYDYLWARLLDETGIEAILVGDSMGMVIQGHDNTLPVTLEQMLYHADMVGRAVRRALVVVDMPFLSFQLGPQKAIENAGRIIKRTRCQAVKLEGGADQADTIRALTRADIPVMAHVGLRPQSMLRTGGFKVQREEETLLADARAAQEAGAFSIVLECVPASTAQAITEALSIPTIGIGAGTHCDGQVLVTQDLLGLFEQFTPRFVKRYAELRGAVADAVTRFRDDVRSGAFPDEEHSFQ